MRKARSASSAATKPYMNVLGRNVEQPCVRLARFPGRQVTRPHQNGCCRSHAPAWMYSGLEHNDSARPILPRTSVAPPAWCSRIGSPDDLNFLNVCAVTAASHPSAIVARRHLSDAGRSRIARCAAPHPPALLLRASICATPPWLAPATSHAVAHGEGLCRALRHFGLPARKAPAIGILPL